VLKLCQRTGDKEGPNVLRAIGDLAITKRDRGKLEEAEELQEHMLKFCQRIGDKKRSIIFENISIGKSSIQVIVSTIRDPISVKSGTVGPRSAQIGRELSEESIRHVLQNRYQGAGSKAAGPQTGGMQFVNRYGAGVKLNLQNLNNADVAT
jgi:hypothetical protein